MGNLQTPILGIQDSIGCARISIPWSANTTSINKQCLINTPGKGLVERKVVRIVTPGTLTEEALLESRQENLLAALAVSGGEFALAWLELASGRFTVRCLDSFEEVEAELERLQPAELLVEEGQELSRAVDAGLRERPPWKFDAGQSARLLREQFQTADLRGFGIEDVPLAITAAGVLLDAYLGCEGAQRIDSYESLTNREREILILVAEGYTNPQIAEMLYISPKTVDGHRTRLMSKLDLHNRTEVVKYALRKQLIEL